MKEITGLFIMILTTIILGSVLWMLVHNELEGDPKQLEGQVIDKDVGHNLLIIRNNATGKIYEIHSEYWAITCNIGDYFNATVRDWHEIKKDA